MVLIILVVAKPYKKKLISRKKHNEVFLKLDKENISLKALDNFITEEELSYSNFRIANAKNNIYSIELRFDKSISQNKIFGLVDKLNNLNGISNAELKAPFQH